MRQVSSVPFDTPAVRTVLAWAFSLVVVFLDARAFVGVGEDRLFLPVGVVLAVGWGVSGLTSARLIGLLILGLVQDILSGGVPGAWLIVTLGTAFLAAAAVEAVVLAGVLGKLLVGLLSFLAAFGLMWGVKALAGTGAMPGVAVMASLCLGAVFLLVFRSFLAVEPEGELA